MLHVACRKVDMLPGCPGRPPELSGAYLSLAFTPFQEEEASERHELSF
jgi:hypothetical protein